MANISCADPDQQQGSGTLLQFPGYDSRKREVCHYSHGLIVEGDNPSPISPKYGQYDFPAIKHALLSEGEGRTAAASNVRS
jgi:hypothetical protein